MRQDEAFYEDWVEFKDSGAERVMNRLQVVQIFLPEQGRRLSQVVRSHYHRHPLPWQLFLLMVLNLVIAPAVAAATGPEISRKAAYALAALGLVVLGLIIYLFIVIFQPERF